MATTQSYLSPRTEITQSFTQTPVSNTPILAAFIVGPQYDLHRYTVAAEKPGTAVVNPTTPSLANQYQYQSNVTYAYPNQAVNTTVDTSYVKVFIDNAYAQYLPNTSLGSTNSNAAAALVAAPGGGSYPNRLRFTNGSTTVLQTANNFNRSSYLSNRDVQVGDIAVITDNLGNTLTTKVTALVADTSAQNGALASVIAPVATTGTDGVTNGTSTFTSAAGAFTTAMVGNFLTIATVGTFKILAVAGLTSITINGTPGSASGLSYTVGGVYNDPSNIAPVAASHGSITYAWTGSGSDPGTTNIAVAASASFAYVGYNNQRILSDTYTATCTLGGGNSVAQFTVSSAHGVFTPVTGVTMNGSGIVVLDANGNNLVRITFTFTSSAVVTIGQAWSIPVVAAVTMVEPTTSGTYTGAGNIVYKLSVTRGGPLYNGSNSTTCAVLSVTSTNVDSSPNVLPQAATAFQVGTLGITATFAGGSNNGGLILGDNYYIPATPAILGAVKTIQFADNLSDNSLHNASTFTVDLAEVQNGYQVNPIASIVLSTLNWVATTSGITINSGITTSDSALLAGSTLATLPLIAGNIYVQYRDLVTINASAIGSLNSTSQITAVLGTIDPDNNLAQGVFEALNNSGGASVYYLAVNTNDLTGYTTALGIAKGSTSVYGLVPLTFDPTIQEAFAAHVDAMSAPSIGRWRDTWICVPAVPTALLYNTQAGGGNWLATVSADPLSSTTVYSLVNVPGATFINDGVRPGDTALLNFVSAPNGTVSYTSIPVGAVRSQTSFVLATGLAAPISVGEKFQLQRNYTPAEQVANLGGIAAGYNDRRVRVVFPDTVESSGVDKAGYYLAAALSGLASGVPANQGLTNSTVLGFDDLTESLITFNSDNLDILAANGVFIVTQKVIGAPPYVRHQLTTAEASGNLNSAEDSITRNVDSISYQLSGILAPYIGKYNINTSTIRLIKDSINSLLNTLQAISTSATAGPQLLPGSQVLTIAQDPTFLDRINVSVQLVVPYPYNYILVNLIVGQAGVTVTTTTSTTTA